MKILFVNHSSTLTGAPISCYNIITHLDSNLSPFYASKKDGPIITMLNERGIKTFIVNTKTHINILCIIKFLKIIKENKIELLHLNSLTNICKYAGIAGYIAHIPIIWFVREDPLANKSKKLKYWLNRLSSKIIFVDNDTKLKLLGNRIHKKVEVIPNGVDLAYYKPEKSNFLFNVFNISQNNLLIGYIGSIVKRKGVNYLIEAFGEIKPFYNSVKLIIIGTYLTKYKDYYNHIKEMIRKYNLEKDIYFTGAIKNVKDAMNCLDIIVLPSLDERCSRTLLECMACAKPIIATNVGGNPEIIKDGFNGILIEAENSKQIAEALKKLIENQNLRISLGTNGRLIAEKNFNIKTNMEKIKTIYQQFDSK